MQEKVRADNTSLDGKIEFFDVGHKYVDTETGDRYQSVTTMLGDWKKGFDADTKSEEVVANPDSKYFGMDAKEVAEAWRLNGKNAAERGTRLHLYAENRINGVKDDLEDTRTKFVDEVLKFLEEEGYELAKTEMLLYSDVLQVAGQCDLLMKKDGDFYLFDWKFLSKEIQRSGFYDKSNGGFPKMAEPFHHLDDCNFIHYSMQMAIYQTLTGDPGKVKSKSMLIVLEDGWEIVEALPMRIYWDELGELQVVHKLWNDKWYTSASNRYSEKKPKWIKGL